MEETEDAASPGDDEQQFWTELESVLRSRCDSYESIDDSLRSFLSLTTDTRRTRTILLGARRNTDNLTQRHPSRPRRQFCSLLLWTSRFGHLQAKSRLCATAIRIRSSTGTHSKHARQSSPRAVPLQDRYLLTPPQEDEATTLHVMAACLLFDGRAEEDSFQLMQSEGMFSRLLDLIKSRQYDGTSLHKMLLELLCEMSRIQQLTLDDMSTCHNALRIAQL